MTDPIAEAIYDRLSRLVDGHVVTREERLRSQALVSAQAVRESEEWKAMEGALEELSARGLLFAPCWHSMVRPDCASCERGHAARIALAAYDRVRNP